MKSEEAIHIAELWAAGKMIGGDEDEVIAALLAEIRRLRLVREFREHKSTPDDPYIKII